jgi:hypothetical protein
MYHKAQCYASDQEAQRKSNPEGKEGISMSACSPLLFPAHPRLRESKAWRRRGEPPAMVRDTRRRDEPVPEQARRPRRARRSRSSPPGSVFRSSALFARHPCGSLLLRESHPNVRSTTHQASAEERNRVFPERVPRPPDKNPPRLGNTQLTPARGLPASAQTSSGEARRT